MKKQKLLFLLTILTMNLTLGQETVGLLYTTDKVFDGYTLFTPELNNNVLLIDNCGNLINEWTFNELPGLTCYLLENGNLLRAGKDSLEIRSWDNDLVWSYNLQDLGYKKHHDIEPLPNGNILCLVKNSISVSDQIEMGKDPSLISADLVSERIIEVQPVGNNQINVVWQWDFLEHIVQDFDNTKINYGIIIDHPELVDFNYGDYNMAHSDWIHMNSIDYNADLDHILMSSKSLGEIYIIDHSTTTAIAATHSGGPYNKGGDFLWRWGNPEVYDRGNSTDRKLFEQHDAKWVENGYLNEGMISVFNNDVGATQTHSALVLLTPAVDTLMGYDMEDNQFLPLDFQWTWEGTVLGETVFQIKKGGAQSLPNGNMLFCETSIGRLTELDPQGNIVWIYKNPSGSQTYDQFTTPAEIGSNNSIFRGEKYPKTYLGFAGQNLTAGAIIEDVNSNSEVCNDNLLAINEMDVTNQIIKFNNPVKFDILKFHSELDNVDINLTDVLGKQLQRFEHFSGKELLFQTLKPGIYFIRIDSGFTQQILKMIVE